MITKKILAELALFPEREDGLRSVERYSLYHTMFYRTNLWTHSRRVAWIVEEIAPIAQKVFGNSFDSERAITLALVHDDAEILFGDIQAGNKAKMTEEELLEIKNMEINAIEALSLRYPKSLGKYDYKSLLMESIEKTSLESMIVSWADKYDAFCEALHELYAGNKPWTVSIENEYGKIDIPTEYYMNYFNFYVKKFPQTQELFTQSNTWLSIPEEPKIFDIISKGILHTKESLQTPKKYIPYDQWVALTLKNGNEEDANNLCTKKEG